MKRKRFGRRGGLGALLACVAAVVATLLLPGPASANTYNVVACNDAGGMNHSWGQWWNSGVSTIASGQGCGMGEYDGNTNKGLFARFIANSVDPGGAAGGWSFAAPGANTIASLTLSDWITRTQGTGAYAIIASDFGLLEGCFSGTSACGWAVPRHTLAVNGSKVIRTEVGCSSVSSCWDNSGNGTMGIIEMYAATVTVNDNSAPSISPSGSMWTGGWMSGTKTVTIAGTDNSDGIQENDLEIDGQTAVSRPHGCDYTYATPCGNQTDAINYDTRQLSDGSHALRALAWDAGRLPAAASVTINVDNHAPDMSQTDVAVNQTDWTPTNSFDLSWTNPGGQTAPIAKAHYSVCEAASPTTCSVTDGQAAGNGIHSISGIQVPAAGDYVVRVWLEDAAGNVNSGMASVPVHLKFDPTVPGQASPEHRNGWINAHDADSFPQRVFLLRGAVKGPSGIKGYAVTTDGSEPGDTVNAPGEDATLTINDLPEGRNVIKARAISGAGVPAADADIGETEVDVDRSKPDVSVSGNPDPGQWQRGPVSLTLTGTDQAGLSGMEGYDPGSGQITDAAYEEYRLDGGSPHDFAGEHQPGLNNIGVPVSIASDGVHTLSFKAVDFAGNESIEKSVQFKIDQTAPELVAFEAQDPVHPATIRVAVTDRTSGVFGGLIQMRRQGDSSWTDLPTRLDGDHLVTTVDDANLPAGAYEFQARARDVAGNEAVSNRRRDGSVEVLTAPFRFNTQMAAGIVRPTPKKARLKNVSAQCRRSKKCMAQVRRQRSAAKRKPKKPLAGTVPTMTVPYGKSALVRGTLKSSEGKPIASQPIDVYQQLDAAGQKMVRVATLRSSASGQFDYHAQKGASRIVRFQFDGTEVLHPAAAEVKLLVPASSTLKASRHKVRNGHSVRFSGRIGRPVVDGLKILDLQAFYRHKWRTFATPRVNAKGGWKYTYRFEATTGVITYKFRVRIRREASYPYRLGYSRITRVTVQG